jgi:hypothetical protein
MASMTNAARNFLLRLGLVEDRRVMTDEDRRKILAILETGATNESISRAFGYSLAEIEDARRADFVTGRLRS